VVVAAIDLPIATTLRPEHLRLADWPASIQPAGVLRDTKDLPGRVVVAKIMQGEPILAAKLASKEAGRGLAALIPVGMRAEAVRVDEVVGVAGFVHPGDRVDVIATLSARGAVSADTISKIVLQNVKVLTVGRDLEVADFNRGKSMPVTVATLLLSPNEAEKLALIANTCKLTLTLRSWTDETVVETPGANPLSLLIGVEALRRPALAPAAVAEAPAPKRKKGREGSAPPAPSVAATPQKDVIEILRGDRFEERKFDKEKP
jgi:pilus assembly protein CpaB